MLSSTSAPPPPPQVHSIVNGPSGQRAVCVWTGFWLFLVGEQSGEDVVTTVEADLFPASLSGVRGGLLALGRCSVDTLGRLAQ